MRRPEIALHLVKADENPVGSDRKRQVQSMGAGSSMICVEMLQVRRAMRPALAVGVRTGVRNTWIPSSRSLYPNRLRTFSIVQQKSVALIGSKGFSQSLAGDARRTTLNSLLAFFSFALVSAPSFLAQSYQLHPDHRQNYQNSDQR